ncbi:MAG TPA: F0F1 ATP synthase subunit B [bacterium]|nr:F0F1 ATP synthase subunit B [bacterium]HQL63206.1 F0F1 ATP synthase subunit B [bacterium]
MFYQLPDLLSMAVIAAESEGSGVGRIVGEIITNIIGFLIVLWILKKFAWRPLLHIMDERRNKIASELHRIEELNRQVQERQEEYEKKLQEIENLSRERINAAVYEGRKIAAEIQANARKEAEIIREKAKATIEIEVAKAREELRTEVVELTLMATEKIIRENLDDDKHRRLITEFVDHLKN